MNSGNRGEVDGDENLTVRRLTMFTLWMAAMPLLSVIAFLGRDAGMIVAIGWMLLFVAPVVGVLTGMLAVVGSSASSARAWLALVLSVISLGAAVQFIAGSNLGR